MPNVGEEDICSVVLVSKVNQEDSSLFHFGEKVSIFLFLLLTITATLGNSLIFIRTHLFIRHQTTSSFSGSYRPFSWCDCAATTHDSSLPFLNEN